MALVPEPPEYVAMPPSLSARVGVPAVVLTVTAELKLTVSVTTLPAFKSPLPPLIPGPEVTIDDTVGMVEERTVICATEVCHQLLATYSLETQNVFGLLGSGMA